MCLEYTLLLMCNTMQFTLGESKEMRRWEGGKEGDRAGGRVGGGKNGEMGNGGGGRQGVVCVHLLYWWSIWPSCET